MEFVALARAPDLVDALLSACDLFHTADFPYKSTLAFRPAQEPPRRQREPLVMFRGHRRPIQGGLRVASIVVVAGLSVGLASCGGDDTALPDQLTRPKQDRGLGIGRGTQDSGGLFGPGGLFGSREEKGKGLNEPGIAVNAFLWRASLDVIIDNKWPIASADPFGGLIITDWFQFTESPNERLKLQVLILDRDLRADAIRASIIRQQQAGGRGWVDAPVDPKTAFEFENAILTRARQLRIAARGN